VSKKEVVGCGEEIGVGGCLELEQSLVPSPKAWEVSNPKADLNRGDRRKSDDLQIVSPADTTLPVSDRMCRPPQIHCTPCTISVHNEHPLSSHAYQFGYFLV
jgi:hypothetical protein